MPDLSRRSSGVLLHVSSLPSTYGIGDLGPAAHQWIDMLAKSKQRWWQMLPLGPCGEGNSPYRCYSAFAGNPLFISPDKLFEDGLLSRSDLQMGRLPPGQVNYNKVNHNKLHLLRFAFDRFQKSRLPSFMGEFDQFKEVEQSWLDDFGLFMALRQTTPGSSWTEWPTPLLKRRPAALKEATAHLAEAIAFHQFIQFIFFRQLQSMRKHAHDSGIDLIGDLPIFLSPESADVWKCPKLFQLDAKLRPQAVAGVPPDLFSDTGQCWGNPLYNWSEMAKDGFAFWRARIHAALRQADLVRIDHFRGFESYWRIPAGADTAESGRWVKAPGKELFEALRADYPQLPLLAEDLGIITPEVEHLRDQFALPGMRVLQFGFTGESGNPHTPHNFIKHCFAYTGTHDNDTTAGWYRSLSAKMRRRLKEYAPGSDWKGDASGSLIRLLCASTANHVTIPLQDILGLGSRARMNRPGTESRNWEWRLQSFEDCIDAFLHLTKITLTYERETP